MTNNPLLQTIMEMILSGELSPGQRVTEVGLAEKLNVSRTPVRNILPRLAAEGFLETVGQRGFAVKAFSDKESQVSLELRALLEGYAARLLAQNGASNETLEQLDELLAQGDALFEKRHLDRDDEYQYGKMNEKFHETIVRAAGSDTLKTFIDRLNMVPFVAPKAIVFDQVGLRKAYELLFRAHGVHHAIVDAIRQRDGHRAEALFREHANQQRFSLFARRMQRDGNKLSEEEIEKITKHGFSIIQDTDETHPKRKKPRKSK